MNKKNSFIAKRIIAALMAIALIVGATVALPQTEIKTQAANDYSCVFNANYYYSANPDVALIIGSSYELLQAHFINYGMAEGRQGCESFNVYGYMAANPDLVLLYGNNLKAYYMHYVVFGKDEGREVITDPALIPDISLLIPETTGEQNNTGDTPKVTPVPTQITPTPGVQDNKNDTSQDSNNSKVVNPVKTKVNATVQKQVEDYFTKSVFVGDSIMVGYRNFVAKTPESPVSKAQFLAATSFSITHALNPASKDSLQPVYQGKKRNVWESISLMGAKHVFLMFGTNDLISKNAYVVEEQMFKLVDKILEVNPDVDIHIISMTPIAGGAQQKGALNNTSIPIYNSRLYADCVKKGYSYVELHKYMLDANGDLRKEYCSDKFVHLLPVAYENGWEPVFFNHVVNCLKKGK
ncbi:MAG: SGNH/GDSL hydrolase family protein [Lachnospiraceae bacterium]|nr:SGNH/GDSL hydrolase family protein [Candidatus Merdinaster equi]